MRARPVEATPRSEPTLPRSSRAERRRFRSTSASSASVASAKLRRGSAAVDGRHASRAEPMRSSRRDVALDRGRRSIAESDEHDRSATARAGWPLGQSPTRITPSSASRTSRGRIRSTAEPTVAIAAPRRARDVDRAPSRRAGRGTSRRLAGRAVAGDDEPPRTPDGFRPVGAWTTTQSPSRRRHAAVHRDTPPPARIVDPRGRRRPARAQVSGAAAGGKGRKVVGLKIGASQIAAAVVVETDAGHELLELARRPLAAGIVVDGEVRDEDALATRSRRSSTRRSCPGTTCASASRATGSACGRSTSSASTTRRRFDNAVRFKAHEVLPVALHESVLDYRVLDERPNEAGERVRRVLLVVAPRDQVEPYQRVAEQRRHQAHRDRSRGARSAAGVRRAEAVRRAERSTTRRPSSSRSDTSRRRCSSPAAAPASSPASSTGAAARSRMRSQRPSTSVRPRRPRSSGTSRCPARGASTTRSTRCTRAKATEAVRLRLTPFARELVNSLQFYQTQAESLGIGGIVITGGTSHLEGLGDALHQMIGVEVSVGDPFARVDSRRRLRSRRSKRRSARWPCRSASRSTTRRCAASTCCRRARSSRRAGARR